MSTREPDKEALKFSIRDASQAEESLRCPYCQDELGNSIKIVECQGCAVQLHRPCAQELKLQCPTLGCATTFEQAPRIEDHARQYARFLIAPERRFAYILPIVASVVFVLGGLVKSNLILRVSAAIAGWWGLILALSGLRMGLALLRVSDGTDMERRVGRYVAVQGSAQATAPLYTPVCAPAPSETPTPCPREEFGWERPILKEVDAARFRKRYWFSDSALPRRAQALYCRLCEEDSWRSEGDIVWSPKGKSKEYCVPFVIGDVTVQNQPTKIEGVQEYFTDFKIYENGGRNDERLRVNYLPPDQNTLAIGQLIRDNRRLLMVPHKSLGLFVASEARTGRLAFSKILKGLTGLAILYIGVAGILHTWVFR